MRKRFVYFLVVLSALLVLGLQSGALAAEETIRFGYLVADQLHIPAPMIMKEQKLLEKEGLQVNWGEFLAGAYLMQHLSSGEVDFGTCGAVPTMITRGRGVDVVILAGSNQEGSSVIVKDSIKTVKDLDGKSIGTPGIGSIQDAMIADVARKNNIKILHKYMKVSDMPIFLKKGEIDGFIAWAPHPSRAEALGYGHILLNSSDMMPGHQCCVLVAKGELLKTKPEVVQKVISAYMKAFDWFRAHRDESIAMMAKMTGMEEKVVRSALKTCKHPYPPFADVPSMKLMAEGLMATDKIQKGVITNMDDFIKGLYHPEFLDAYLAKKK